jgi:hypothetical protein
MGRALICQRKCLAFPNQQAGRTTGCCTAPFRLVRPFYTLLTDRVLHYKTDLRRNAKKKKHKKTLPKNWQNRCLNVYICVDYTFKLSVAVNASGESSGLRFSHSETVRRKPCFHDCSGLFRISRCRAPFFFGRRQNKLQATGAELRFMTNRKNASCYDA